MRWPSSKCSWQRFQQSFPSLNQGWCNTFTTFVWKGYLALFRSLSNLLFLFRILHWWSSTTRLQPRWREHHQRKGFGAVQPWKGRSRKAWRLVWRMLRRREMQYQVLFESHHWLRFHGVCLASGIEKIRGSIWIIWAPEPIPHLTTEAILSLSSFYLLLTGLKLVR